MKVVINRKSVGLFLTNEAMEKYCRLSNIKVWPQVRDTEDGDIWWWTVPPEEQPTLPEGITSEMGFDSSYALYHGGDILKFARHLWRLTVKEDDIDRGDKALVQIVEESEDVTHDGELAVVEIPDGIEYEIDTGRWKDHEEVVARWR